MSNNIVIIPVELRAYSIGMRGANERNLATIKHKLNRRYQLNEGFGSESRKRQRRASLDIHMFSKVDEAGLKNLIGTFPMSYNKRDENRPILNRATWHRKKIPFSMRERFFFWSVSELPAGTTISDTRWYADNERWEHIEWCGDTALVGCYNNVVSAIEEVLAAVETHRNTLVSFFKSGGDSDRHYLSPDPSVEFASNAYVSRLNHISEKAQEVFVGVGGRAGQEDGIVSSVRIVLEVLLKNLEIAYAKGEELATQGESCATDAEVFDAAAKCSFQSSNEGGGILQHVSQVVRSQVELKLHRPNLLFDGKGLETAYAEQHEKRYADLKKDLTSALSEVTNLIASDGGFKSISTCCEEAIVAINRWQALIERNVAVEVRVTEEEPTAEFLSSSMVVPSTKTVSRWEPRRSLQRRTVGSFLSGSIVADMEAAKTVLEAWRTAFLATELTARSFAKALSNGYHVVGLSERVKDVIYLKSQFESLQAFAKEAKGMLIDQASAYFNFENLVRDNMSGDTMMGYAMALFQGNRYFHAVAQTIEKDFFKGGFEGSVDKVSSFPPSLHATDLTIGLKVTFGLIKEQIEFGESLGYTPEALWELFSNFGTEVDAEFFSYLLDGNENAESFASAFAINPSELSNEMTFVMAEFAGSLLYLDQNNETYHGVFMVFNNAILGANGYSGCASAGFKRHGEHYIEMMYVGAFTTAEINSFFIAAGLGSEEIQDQYEIQRSLTGLWASQAMMIAEILRGRRIPLLDPGSIGSPPQLEMSISNIVLQHNGNIDFDITYRLPPDLGVLREDITISSVSTQVIRTGAGVANAEREGRLEEIRQAQERFLGNLVVDTLVGTSYVSLGFAAPKVAVFLGIVRSLARGGGQAGLRDLADPKNKGLTNTLKGADFLIMQQIVGAYFAWQDIDSQMDDTNREKFIAWFGSGNSINFYSSSPFITDRGTFQGTQVVHSGLYNPETIRLMNVWQNEGLGGWYDLEEEVDIGNQTMSVYEVIRREADRLHLENPPLAADIELLLYGGFPIFGVQDDNGNFTFEGNRFVAAINEIHSLFRDDIPFLFEWHRLINLSN